MDYGVAARNNSYEVKSVTFPSRVDCGVSAEAWGRCASSGQKRLHGSSLRLFWCSFVSSFIVEASVKIIQLIVDSGADVNAQVRY